MGSPHPRIRMLSALLGMVGVLWISDLMILIGVVVWLFLLIVKMGLWKRYASMLKVFAALALGLVAVWAGIMGAPPGHPIASDRVGGLVYAMTIVLRLVAASSIAQICILGIPASELPQVLAACGIHGNALASAIAAFVLIPEAELRVGQVLMARYARGLSHARTFWGLAVHVPATLRPVLAWTLRSAIVRSEHWNQRKLIEQLEARSGTIGWSKVASVAWLLCSVGWLACVAFVKLGR